MKNKPLKLRQVFGMIVFLTILTVFAGIMLIFRLPFFTRLEEPQPVIGFLLMMLICFLIGVSSERFVREKIFSPILKLNAAMKEVAAGNFRHRLAMDKDISQIEEIREMIQHFNTMTKELDSIEMLRADFVSNVSHEFKTPLSAIEGYGTLLQNSELPLGERQEYLARILSSTRRLATLTDNILKISRLETGDLAIEKKTFDLTEQIRLACLSFQYPWEHIELEEITYRGNPELLFQVWTNLIGNAIKFTEEGGQVRVKLRQEPGKILVEVADSGIGMPPQVLTHIFEKFYQGDSSRQQEGNGLGLALVSRIVTLHGGTVQVSSKEGEGSIFTVVLPISNH